MGCIKSRTQEVFPKDKVLYNKEVHTKRKFFTGLEAGKGDIGMAGHLQVAYNVYQSVHYDRVNGGIKKNEFEIPTPDDSKNPIPSILEVVESQRQQGDGSSPTKSIPPKELSQQD